MNQKDLIFLLTILLLILLIIALAVFYFILPGNDPFNLPGTVSIATPADWITPNVTVRHDPVADIRPRMLPAHRIVLSEAQSSYLMKPTRDGGCLAVSTIKVNDQESAGPQAYLLRAVHFRSDGTVLWERQYDAESFYGYPAALCILPDNGFAVSLRVSSSDTLAGETTDRLLRFAADGILMWQTPENQIAPGSLDYLFAVPDGSVITAGTIQSAPSDPSAGDLDIVLLRFTRDGKQSSSLIVGRTGYDYLLSASYGVRTGLVLIWQSEATGSQAAEGGSILPASKICCYSNDLQEQWITALPPDVQLSEVRILPDDQDVLVFTTAPAAAADTSDTAPAADSRSTLQHLDPLGKVDWTYQASETMAWLVSAVKLSDGRFVLGQLQTVQDWRELSSLIVLSAEGQVQQAMDSTPGAIRQMIPTRDGGLTVVSQQALQAIPQPPFVSSIWIDTAAIIAHYDRNLQLVWRRTIDQYRHQLQVDLVVATVDDNLLIG